MKHRTQNYFRKFMYVQQRRESRVQFLIIFITADGYNIVEDIELFYTQMTNE